MKKVILSLSMACTSLIPREGEGVMVGIVTSIVASSSTSLASLLQPAVLQLTEQLVGNYQVNGTDANSFSARALTF